jgi:hypothetical protein
MNWKPQDSPLWEVRLQWMLENEPELVNRLFQTDPKRLQKHLDLEVDSALAAILKLKQAGLSEEDAQERVIADQVAPSTGRASQEPPPEPLPQAMLDRIRKWTWNLAERDTPTSSQPSPS